MITMLSLVGALSSCLVTHQAEDKAFNYGLGLGAKWTYEVHNGTDNSSLTIEVIKVLDIANEKVFKLETKASYGSNFGYKVVRKGSLYEHIGDYEQKEDITQLYAYPALMGPFKKDVAWNWTVTREEKPSEDSQVTKKTTRGTSTIVSEETLTVKAGKYHCFAVKGTQEESFTVKAAREEGSVAKDTVKEVNGTKLDVTMWISPKVGMVKMKVGEGTWELTDYKPGKD